MTGRTHIVYKFKNSTVPLLISYNEHVKDVVFEKRGIVFIHCMTMTNNLYIFTICVDYSICPFHLQIFLKSLENSNYEPLMKEIEDQMDKKNS